VVLVPGRYRLEVRGLRGDGMAEEQVDVLPASSLPPLPRELDTRNLSPVLRDILHAEYLLSLDQGRWTLAALQLVAAHAERDPVASAWVDHIAGRMKL
jgi:hypothetical protein